MIESKQQTPQSLLPSCNATFNNSSTSTFIIRELADILGKIDKKINFFYTERKDDQ